eukprot:scaffold133990_cov21-Tisochrysis_lutea.AAC.2
MTAIPWPAYKPASVYSRQPRPCPCWISAPENEQPSTLLSTLRKESGLRSAGVHQMHPALIAVHL